MNTPGFWRGRASGKGLPHSQTLPRYAARLKLPQVLGCGSPLPLWLWAVSLILTLVQSAAAPNLPITLDSDVDAGTLEFKYKGRKLLVYAFATNQFKPYVRELYTLRGENVLRDAPPDHLHHHGMMYAVWVNGVNFWEEKGAPGVQRHIKLQRVGNSEANGKPVARFSEVIHWLAPTNLAAPLLLEERTLAVTVDEKRQEVALRWDSAFTARQAVKLHGPNYDGLGLRLPESFNHVAKFQNSANAPYTGNNTQNTIAAQWTSVSGQMGGRDVMLVMFGRKDNARGDGIFFTMLDPFAYLSVTQGLDKKPLEYSAGDKFTLSYLLTVYSGNKSAEFIRHRRDQWEQEHK